MNVSRETTVKEIVDIQGMSKHDQKMNGINLSGGHTNAVEFCTSMFNFPQLTKMLANFENQFIVTDVEIKTSV